VVRRALERGEHTDPVVRENGRESVGEPSPVEPADHQLIGVDARVKELGEEINSWGVLGWVDCVEVGRRDEVVIHVKF